MLSKEPTEIVARGLVITEAVDILCNIYNIPRNTAMVYIATNEELVDNITDRMDEAMLMEIEDWIPSTDILTYQEGEE